MTPILLEEHFHAFQLLSSSQPGMTWAEVESLLSEMIVKRFESKGYKRPAVLVPSKYMTMLYMPVQVNSTQSEGLAQPAGGS